MGWPGDSIFQGKIVRERDWQKYLKKCRLLPTEPLPLSSGFRVIAVIPACDELEEIGDTLNSLHPSENEAVLVIVNHPVEIDDRVRNSSAELLRRLRSGVFSCPNLHWIDAPDLTGGVGEARKLGMDAVIASQLPEALEETVIASLDADTVVTPDYFSAIRNSFSADPSMAALSIPFRHRNLVIHPARQLLLPLLKQQIVALHRFLHGRIG